MDQAETDFIDAYIRANDVTANETSSWAIDEMRQRVWNEPERAWPAVLSIIERRPPVWVVSSLAAGPLEDLLRVHGPLFIDRVEQESARNECFREALSHLYLAAFQPEIAQRVQYLRGG